MAVQISKPAAPAVVPSEKSSGELQEVLKQIAKDKGEGVVIAGSTIPAVTRIPTGMFEFDLATNGGFPEGRISIVYGPEGSGKTNLTYCAISRVQARPGPHNKVVFVDLEGTFDPEWAALFGVNTDDLLVVKPGYGEEAVDLIVALVHADDVALIVVDSLAVLVASKEVDASVEKADVGTAPMLVKRLCNKIVIAQTIEGRRGHKPAVILLNQTRFKIGVMFGDPETMPGGQTMKFLSSLTVRLYGKNKILKEVDPTLPAFKETHAVIKKAKVPINKMSFDYEMCVYPHDMLRPGETRSWGLVAADLKTLGKLEKDGQHWKLLGQKYPTLLVLQEKYETDLEFMLELQKIVIDSYKGQAKFVEVEKE